ncbi:hypothetical protein FHR83_007023 [Actinoplanes campanulatus]|uniref:Uncharacterized protein n=1 Tax=Actinoplanes campanulatus TaxID=113559 RepID=A0A7W5AN33_9ACTN|nr:hypothetical protein [Actinoplanes campanulatus]MBB3099317.1 hypothetical protein [Actinoplanes campanulatus]GGN40507.1 hypothetical protein GCM10010109_69680 [Actinoplanes campanulatus]GID40635.1 hypothetical protein Aca09nite_71410 [Actinoplanes campanulatus]
MTVLAARLRPRWDLATGRIATLAGALVGKIGRGLPGIGGPLLVAFGLWLAWAPLGFIFAGLALWALDRRV